MKMNGIRRELTRLTMLIGCTLVVLGCSLSADVAPATSTSSQLTPSITTGATQVPQTTAKSIIQRIQFQPGATSATVTGQLAAHGTDQWIVGAQSGQKFSAQLAFSSGQATLSITDSNGKTILSNTAHATTFTSVLGSAQDYNINVSNSDQIVTNYTLTVTLEDESQPKIQRIQFQPGTTSTTVTGHVIPNGADYWVVKAQAGQTLSVKLALSSGKASVNVSGADGDLLKFAQTTFTSFDGKLQTSQDYNIIVVWNEGAVADYSLTLSIQ